MARLKIKTKRGAAKRFKINKSGKVKHRCAFRNHILTKKSQSRKRALRQGSILSEGDARSVRRMLVQE